jgi:hypothetical protein
LKSFVFERRAYLLWSAGLCRLFDLSPDVPLTPWVTSLPVCKDNVAEIVACARARSKIEKESFNVLKNHGYELEHNFGHGQRFLAMTLAAFNLLAFAWHTVLELLEPTWQAARAAAAK